MVGLNHMGYTLKGPVNDTLGALLEPYKKQEFLISKQCEIPYTTYSYSSYEVWQLVMLPVLITTSDTFMNGPYLNNV